MKKYILLILSFLVVIQINGQEIHNSREVDICVYGGTLPKRWVNRLF